MAWNKPTNINNQDPKNNKNKKNNNDLDDILALLLDKIKNFFTNNSKGSAKGALGLLAIAVLIWGASGFYTLKTAEQSVVLRFGKVHKIIDQPGLQWHPVFIDSYSLVDIRSIHSLSTSGTMLTRDENLAEVEMEVLFRIQNPRNYLYSATNPQSSIRHALDSALRYVVGHTSMDDLLTTGREQVRINTKNELEAIINSYKIGLEIVEVNFQDARPPDAVRDAFDDAVAAREDQERYINVAKAYAREQEPRARGDAQRILEDALAYKSRVTNEAQGSYERFNLLLPEYQKAKTVTKKRLYIETMQSIYENTSKIMLDTNNSNNMLYLPIDKIMQNQEATAVNSKKSTPSKQISKPAPSKIESSQPVRTSRGQ